MAEGNARSYGMPMILSALAGLLLLLFSPAVALAQEMDEPAAEEEEAITEGAAESAAEEEATTEEAPEPEATAEEEETTTEEAPAAEEPQPAEEAPTTGKGAAGLPLSVCSEEVQEHWRMFVHRFRVARFDVAAQEGKAVLDAKLPPTVMLDLAESTGYETLVKMLTVAELKDVATKVLEQVHEGMRERRTDVARIEKNLQRLAQGPRPYFLALKELKDSGPYAVPAALVILGDAAKREKIGAEVCRALGEIGRPVVLPLTYALATKDEALKRTICDVLGAIGYPYALPALKAVAEDKAVSDVTRQAATDAMRKISADPKTLETPAKLLYLDLARSYYDGKIKGIADERMATTDVFGWDEEKGLIYKAVPSEVVAEVLCARACADALKTDPAALDAVALWLKAQMRMKAKLPQKTIGEANPFSPAGMPDVDFFALAVGQQYLLEVLAGALKADEPAVALQAIEALEEVAGERFLRTYGQSGLASPLVEALSYPDRRVRFAAAFALAAVEPYQKFQGAERVVPVLAEAINLEAGKAVIVAEAEADNRNRIKSALKDAGYEVVDVDAANVAVDKAAAMPRLDAVIISSRIKEANHGEVIKILRGSHVTALTPIVVLSWPDDPVGASDIKAKYKYVEVLEADAKGEDVGKAIDQLSAAAGALVLDADAAKAISIQAAKTLKAIAGTSLVYDARAAREVLLDTLTGRPAELTIIALQTLAKIADAEICQAIADVATAADTPMEVRLAALESLARASRDIGNNLKPETVEKLRDMAGGEDEALRNAAAKVLGALNLSPAEGAKTILKFGAP